MNPDRWKIRIVLVFGNFWLAQLDTFFVAVFVVLASNTDFVSKGIMTTVMLVCKAWTWQKDCSGRKYIMCFA